MQLSGQGNEFKAKEQGGVNMNQNIGTEEASFEEDFRCADFIVFKLKK
ncbi:hypothetical protein AB1L12_16585 [Peribacillus frigoritolerans]|jgi:hypothetical protein